MNENRQLYSIMLILISGLALLVTYKILDLSKLEFSYIGISADSSAVLKEEFWVVARIAVLLGLSVAHVSYYKSIIAGNFSHGFRYNAKISAELKAFIVSAAAHDKIPAPVGNISPSLFPTTNSLGVYSKADGTYTENLYYRASLGVHYTALGAGVLRSLGGLGLAFWFPIFIMVWALFA